MAKPKTRTRKSTTTRKSKSKKAAKKTVKKAAKKMAAKKVKEPRAKREKKERPSIKTIYANILTLRDEVQQLRISLINSKISKSAMTAPTDSGQMDFFDDNASAAPDLKSNGNGSGSAITKEDVTQALQEVMANSGTDQVKEILGMHDAKKISDLTPGQWASCYKMCKDNITTL